jgi:hypothetical protein
MSALSNAACCSMHTLSSKQFIYILQPAKPFKRHILPTAFTIPIFPVTGEVLGKPLPDGKNLHTLHYPLGPTAQATLTVSAQLCCAGLYLHERDPINMAKCYTYVRAGEGASALTAICSWIENSTCDETQYKIKYKNMSDREVVYNLVQSAKNNKYCVKMSQ